MLRRESAEQLLVVGELAEHIAVVAQDYRFGAHEMQIIQTVRPSLPVRQGREIEETS